MPVGDAAVVEDSGASSDEEEPGGTRGRGKGAKGAARPRKYFTATVEEIMEMARSGKSQQVQSLRFEPVFKCDAAEAHLCCV